MYIMYIRSQIKTQSRAHLRVASLVKSREKETEAREKDAEPGKNKLEVNTHPNKQHMKLECQMKDRASLNFGP